MHGQCVVLQTRTQFGDRSFAVVGPRIWNSLPAPLRDMNSILQLQKAVEDICLVTAVTHSDCFCALQILLLT